MTENEELRKRANAGDAAAQDELGRKIFVSMETPADLEEAVELFSKSADQGYAPACVDMARVYLMGLLRDSKNDIDVKEIQRLLKFAAKKNEEEANFILENEIFDWPINNPNMPTYGISDAFFLQFGKKDFAIFYRGGSLMLTPHDAQDLCVCRKAIGRIEITKSGLFKKGRFTVYGNSDDIFFSKKYTRDMNICMEAAIFILKRNKVKLVLS